MWPWFASQDTFSLQGVTHGVSICELGHLYFFACLLAEMSCLCECIIVEQEFPAANMHRARHGNALVYNGASKKVVSRAPPARNWTNGFSFRVGKKLSGAEP